MFAGIAITNATDEELHSAGVEWTFDQENL